MRIVFCVLRRYHACAGPEHVRFGMYRYKCVTCGVIALFYGPVMRTAPNRSVSRFSGPREWRCLVAKTTPADLEEEKHAEEFMRMQRAG